MNMEFPSNESCETPTIKRRVALGQFFTAVFLMIIAAGCTSPDGSETRPGSFVRVFTPQMPEFLVGSAGALLTNASGYSARLTFQTEIPATQFGVGSTEGELLSRGTQLLFAPHKAEGAGKDLQLGGFSYVWNVATASGYIFSEALQGYAPVASSLLVTNVSVRPIQEGADKGVVVQMNDGSAQLLQVRRTTEVQDVVVQIDSTTNRPPFGLRLSKLRLEAPPANLFVPPSEFTKYPSAEALADELAARRNNIRRSSRYSPGPSTSP